ncbi:hypothetical protein QQF64_036242 [Cirrhinus molitorella]|uniref:Uncharacterized protein n=1 Tax=Cirrhinus molitorella TaxID=172907 RepID=A0ABR3NI85_9TELE
MFGGAEPLPVSATPHDLESEVTVPSAHAFVQRCHRTWRRARETLLRVGSCMKAQADRHRSKPPVYVVVQQSLFTHLSALLHVVMLSLDSVLFLGWCSPVFLEDYSFAPGNSFLDFV